MLFRSTNDLTYIGAIDGHPFKEYNNYNGFDGMNTVTGIARCDIIYTTYGYYAKWYDMENRKLVDYQGAYYTMLPYDVHELFIDLPIYISPSQESERIILPAQEKVFFTMTDGKEWIKVRGKDGTKGYFFIKEYSITTTSLENDARSEERRVGKEC